MPFNDSDSKIRELTDEFVSQLSVVIREAALEAVRDAIEGVGGSSAPTRRRRKAARKAGRKKAARRKASRKKRTRRSAADYSALGDKILAYVKAHPGCGAGDIAKSVRSTTTAIRPVTAGLIADGKLRTTGQRRGTKYFAGSGGGGGRRKKKATRKKAGRKTTKKKARRKKATRRKASRRKVAAKRATSAEDVAGC